MRLNTRTPIEMTSPRVDHAQIFHKLYIYYKYFVLQFKALVVLKYSFAFTIFFEFTTPLFFVILWSSVIYLSKDKKISDFDQSSIIGYYLIGILLQKLGSTNVAKNLNKIIKNKFEQNASFFLLNYLNLVICIIITFLSKIIATLICSIIFLLIIFSIDPDLRRSISSDPFNICAFILFFILGFIINSLFNSIIGLLRFYSVSAGSIRAMTYNFVAFLSGQFIPLSFLPKALKNVVSFLPFSYSYYFPLSVILGKKSKLEVLTGALIALFWIFILFICARYMYRNGMKYFENFD